MKRLPLFVALAILVTACSSYRPSRRVAIMDFEVATGNEEDAGLGVAIPEFLLNYIADADKIQIIERQDMNRYLGARYGEKLQRLKYERWKDIGKRIGADYFIAGSVAKLESNYIVSARLFSVSKGRVVPGSAISAHCARMADLYPQMRQLAKFFAYQIQKRQPPPPGGMQE